MGNEKQAVEDLREPIGLLVVMARYEFILKNIESLLDTQNITVEIDNKVRKINLSNGNSDNFEFSKMSCLMLMTLTGGDINKKGISEIISKQSAYYLRYLEEARRCICIEESTKDYSNLMISKKETLEKMQELCNQSEKIGLEPDKPILKEEILLPYQTVIRNIHELATTMLLVNEKQEEFVREKLSQEMFLDTIDGIVKATMSGEKEAQEQATENFETLKQYTTQVLELANTRQQLTENRNKIKMLVSPESAKILVSPESTSK